MEHSHGSILATKIGNVSFAFRLCSARTSQHYFHPLWCWLSIMTDSKNLQLYTRLTGCQFNLLNFTSQFCAILQNGLAAIIISVNFYDSLKSYKEQPQESCMDNLK